MKPTFTVAVVSLLVILSALVFLSFGKAPARPQPTEQIIFPTNANGNFNGPPTESSTSVETAYPAPIKQEAPPFSPPSFIGPSGAPHINGPKSPPPG
ncbi:MAG: hypothetical protein Q7S36_02255 [Candidatus Liptonbacteria bacterium]|nr:hypothetical protein [Candidatus Liptonbacteria bacterium]